MKFFVGVAVHDDGDIELTRHAEMPYKTWDGSILYFNNEEALTRELICYGAEEPRIAEALKELETETPVII